MSTANAAPISPFRRGLNKTGTWISKPENSILVILGLALSLVVFYPMVLIIMDSFLLHVGTYEPYIAADMGFINAKGGTYNISNWGDIFSGSNAVTNFWRPFGNTMALAALSCVFALVFGGTVAYLVTRTNLPCRKYISSIFIFPYIMPQWTLAIVWKNLFWSNAVTGGSNGLLAATLGWTMPLWWCQGLFPSAMVLGMHYAPFAYILIGGIFKNMDASLEEAATILNTPKWKIVFRITLPLVMPAILSTILLVFSSAMGSYPVPHYLGGKNFSVFATKYIEMKVNLPGEASIIAIIMGLIGVLILLINQFNTSSRKQFITVSGKSAQASKVRLGKVTRWVIAVILILLTAMTSIYPLISFALETFLANPGDYTEFTTKWWVFQGGSEDVGMYGQFGILYNKAIWSGFGHQVLVALVCSLAAGTLGFLVGYAVSKQRHSKLAAYVNGISFLPYLLPSVAVGVAFFIFGTKIGWTTVPLCFLLLCLAGIMKYIPFASRSSLNAMMQLSGEIEEAAIIQGAPWWKRMTRIIIPIQKSTILSGYLLPFITAMRELNLFMLLAPQSYMVTTLLDYFDEMGLYALSSGINLLLIIFILLINGLVNLLTGATIDSGIGGK
jgi:iron(III) transport system permease protein